MSLHNLQNALRDLAIVRIRVRLGLRFGSRSGSELGLGSSLDQKFANCARVSGVMSHHITLCDFDAMFDKSYYSVHVYVTVVSNCGILLKSITSFRHVTAIAIRLLQNWSISIDLNLRATEEICKFRRGHFLNSALRRMKSGNFISLESLYIVTSAKNL